MQTPETEQKFDTSSAVVLAIDIGTSATKGVWFYADGRIGGTERAVNAALRPQPSYHEQDAEGIVDGVKAVLTSACARMAEQGVRLAAVSFSSQMYSILAVDERQRVRSHSLTWADARAAEIAAGWRADGIEPSIHYETGCPLQALYPLAKIAWLQNWLKGEAGLRFVSVKEYVLYRLTGEWLVDWQTASASGCFDIRQRQWNGRALALAGLRAEDLSEVVAPRHVLRNWTAEALECGLLQGTPCVIGGGDGPLASMGLGAFSPQTVAVNVGTSAAGRCMVETPTVDAHGGLWTYAVDEGLWVTGSMVATGGTLFDWAAHLCGMDDLDAAAAAAGGVAPGAEGLLLLPFLGGQQCPVWNPMATGTLYGLTYRHGKAHLMRAAMEGIARSLEQVIATIGQVHGQHVSQVRLSGGLSHSLVWRQIAADMFGLPVAVPDSPDASAKGAAMMAMLALGEVDRLEQLSGWVGAMDLQQADPQAHAFYQRQKAVYERMSAETLPTPFASSC